MTDIKQFILAMLIFALFLLCGFHLSAKEKDTGLLLAQSLWGECGIDCIETDEASIVFHVYLKLSKRANWTLYKSIKRYSGAVKNQKHHPNRWILHLNRDLAKPKHWPNNLSWKNHQDKWEALLKTADEWVSNPPPDMYPETVHYCGRFEKQRASYKLKIVKLGLRNVFFEYRFEMRGVMR